MKRQNILTLVLTATLLLVAYGASYPALRGVYDSPHNFSASRQTGVGSSAFGSTEERICVFCHIPHHASDVEGALWSRDISDQSNYRMYESPTLSATIELMPTGASRLCLGCHDGTIAIGALQGGYTLTSAPSLQGNPNQLALVDTSGRRDLSGDHPISFFYPVKDGLVPAQSIAKPVALAPGNRLECTACHNPHSNDYGKFLVLDNSDGIKLCAACHVTPGWAASPYSAHKVNITSNNLGCGICHDQHKASGRQYLLKNGTAESNCLTTTCHATVAASFNAAPAYSHPVINQNNQIHTLIEPLPLSASLKHVTCDDCHNPHQAQAVIPATPLTLLPPDISASGPLSGVRGVNTGSSVVNPARYEYEICARCHSGGSAANFTGGYGPSPLLPLRQVRDIDELNRFASTNASFHPVIQTTRQLPSSFAVLSLINATVNQIITCTACHVSHGATYPHQVRYRYDTDSLTNPSSFNYELCFTCHKPFNGYASGFSAHQSHVFPTGVRKPVPCSGCHDPHGVNVPHLINFDLNMLPATPSVVPKYLSTGVGTGSCTVSCHTKGNPDIYTYTYP